MEVDRETADRMLLAGFHLTGLALALHLVIGDHGVTSIPFLRQVGFILALGHLTTLAGASWYLDLLRLVSTLGWPIGLTLIGISSLGGQDLRLGAIIFLVVNGGLYWLAGRLAGTNVSLVPALALGNED